MTYLEEISPGVSLNTPAVAEEMLSGRKCYGL